MTIAQPSSIRDTWRQRQEGVAREPERSRSQHLESALGSHLERRICSPYRGKVIRSPSATPRQQVDASYGLAPKAESHHSRLFAFSTDFRGFRVPASCRRLSPVRRDHSGSERESGCHVRTPNVSRKNSRTLTAETTHGLTARPSALLDGVERGCEMVNDVSSPLGRVVVRFAVVELFHPKRWPACRVGVQVPRVRAVKKRRPGCGKPHANLITRGQWPNPDVSSVLRSPRAGDFGLRAEVERTGLFSLRENAIAKEPGSSYLKPWRCASRLGR